MRLINAKYKLNREEIEFLIKIIKNINSDEISIDSESYNLKFMKKFISKPLELSTNEGFIFVNWFSKIEFNHDMSIIKVKFQDDVREFLLTLSNDLEIEDLKYFFLLPNNYSRAIYKLLKAYEHKSSAVINLEDLKKRLQVPKGLHLYSNFKMKVLNIAQEELSEFSDISFTIIEKKDGKKVSSIIFNINREKVPKEILQRATAPAIIQEKQELSTQTEASMVQNALVSFDKKLSPENEDIKRIVNLFDFERKKIQPNFVRREFKNIDGEYLLRMHLKETQRTTKMFFDAIRWLFSTNPQAAFHRQNIMNIAKLIEHFNTLEHQAMYSEKAVSFNEEAQSWYNIYKKRGLPESEILEILKEGGYL